MESWLIFSEIPGENALLKMAKKSLRFGMMMEAFALPDENSLFEFRTELTIWRSCARHSTLSSSCWVTFVEKIFGSSKILLGMYSRVSNKRGKVYPSEWTDNSTYLLFYYVSPESGFGDYYLVPSYRAQIFQQKGTKFLDLYHQNTQKRKFLKLDITDESWRII